MYFRVQKLLFYPEPSDNYQPLSMAVESENMDKYFVTQITVLRGTKLQNLDSKLEALAGQISPVSFQAFICFSYISIQRASRNLTL